MRGGGYGKKLQILGVRRVCIVFGLLHITWRFVAVALIAFSTMIRVIALFKYHSVNTIALAHVVSNTIISISRVLNGL